jgi:hypothetical protein
MKRPVLKFVALAVSTLLAGGAAAKLSSCRARYQLSMPEIFGARMP